MKKYVGEEFSSAYDVCRMGCGERISAFDCGDPDLNDFILNESGKYTESLLAVSYVLKKKLDPDTVIAYFSLANDKISLDDFSSKTSFNRFRKSRFVNAKRLRSYPAVKICRLGVTSLMKGKCVGTFLIDFIKTYFSIDNKAGCRFLTVDAYIDALPFYLKNGFVPLVNEDDGEHHTQLLFYDLAAQ